MKTLAKNRSLGALFLAFGLAAGGAACNNDRDDKDDVVETKVERTGTTTRTTVSVDTRNDYAAEARARLARLDAKLTELRARTDEKAAQAAADLQVKRDQLARQLDSAATQAESGWEKFKADVGRGFDELEDGRDDATH
jgi:hypothetical protein